MKANELMIGNAIMYNGHIFKVTDISSAWPRENDRYNNKPVVTIFNEGIFTVGIDEIQPIPITEEFLKKNGFKNRYNVCYEKEIKAYYVEINKESNMGDEYMHCHVDNCSRLTVADADIRYVHHDC